MRVHLLNGIVTGALYDETARLTAMIYVLQAVTRSLELREQMQLTTCYTPPPWCFREPVSGSDFQGTAA
jgi:hypothetical protein